MTNGADSFLVFPVKAGVNTTPATPASPPPPQPLFCVQCGIQITEPSAFCTNCGTRVTQTPGAQPAPQPAVAQQAAPQQAARQPLPLLRQKATLPASSSLSQTTQTAPLSPPVPLQSALPLPGTPPTALPALPKMPTLPKNAQKREPGIGIFLLVVGLALMIFAFWFGTSTFHYEWYQIFYTFIAHFDLVRNPFYEMVIFGYPPNTLLEILSFCLSFILYGGALLALSSIVAFFPSVAPEDNSTT